MGYYTKYSLHAEPKDLTKHYRDLLSEYLDMYECNFNGEDPTPWYDHESDLCEFSDANNGIIFELRGRGQKAGDIWVKYFYNGDKIYEWELEYEFPELPEEIRAKLSSVIDGNVVKKKAALDKLTAEERKLLGLD